MCENQTKNEKFRRLYEKNRETKNSRFPYTKKP